ncbi:hat family dimerization domaincontaining protein-related [Holotrichia oblita]|uniref:Hat family dimerization domaincontaining protein-related n=1 Tax=Holotrichia oblita TaxID=644536 RepID=A0ACB9SFK4_HOLOL|nr:hat family dimerization domaincontaining protein-related [Holotrichia oblita]
MNVPFKNVLGFASDGCNTMMGRRSSVSARMYADYPGLHIHKCHSLHLVASEACKMLPRRCEDLCRDIHNYFKASAKRKSELKEFQIFCELDPHKMLRPSQTRWLSLAQAVKELTSNGLHYHYKLMVVIDCINPDNVINKKTHSLYNLLKLTPRIIDIDQHSQVQIIDSQWRELLTYDVSQYSNKEVDKFWVAVGNIFDGNGQPLFKELAEYCLNVLSIPPF